MRRRLLLVAVAVLALTAGSTARVSSRAMASPSVSAYEGLGTWVDIYPPVWPWTQPKRAVDLAVAHGVRTLYVETSNYSATPAIRYPVRLGQLIDLAHARGIRVVGWYLPALFHIGTDLQRIVVGANYRSPLGEGLDSMAVDIESSAVADPALRSARLLELGSWLRAALGPSYPLGAIIPSPRGMQLHPSYWPGFPFSSLHQSFDVVVPMDYATYHVHTVAGVLTYTRTSLRILAHRMGTPALPIHEIGGLGPASGRWMTFAFVKTALEQGVIGASLYDLPTTRPGAWWALEHVR